MDWVLKCNVPDSEYKIQSDDRLIFIGSCFAEHISARLTSFKWQVCNNPFGVIYHPNAILNALKFIAQKNSEHENRLVKIQGIWYSWDHHSKVSHHSKDELLKIIRKTNAEFLSFVKNARFIFISLGSAYYYRLKSDGRTVANCHKAPASDFDKRLSSVEELTLDLNSTVRLLKSLNPEIKIVWTISPVRHYRDGLIENQNSKSLLRVALLSCLEKSQDYYFPSYEILIDSLRDYRWYTSDLAHPNEMAIDHIWDRFCAAMMSEESKRWIQEMHPFLNTLSHKPRHTTGTEFQKYTEYLNRKLLELQELRPQINWNPEREKIDGLSNSA